MPYNLRKRKIVEPVISVPEPKKKRTKSVPKVEKVAESPKALKKEKQEDKKEDKKLNNKVEKKIEKKVEKKVEKDIEKEEKKLTSRIQLVFGEDTCGELGLGKIGLAKKSPTNVPIDENIVQIVCGPVHTLSLTQHGQVYSFGCNDEGALGRETNGDETLEATPTIVSLDNKVTKISAGDSHSAALTNKGEIFIWGNFRDEHGTIGLTPSCEGKSTFKPIQIMPDVEFKDIASGSNHMLLLDVDGVVYSFGVGAQGQLGRLSPDDVGEGANSKPITAENSKLFLTPQKVNINLESSREFICDAIYAGNFSSFATNTDKKKNRLAGWGLNNFYQLGYKGLKGQLVQHVPKRATFTCSTSIKGVACGPHHTLFLTKTGRIYSAGRDEYGMLGLGKVGKEVCPPKNIAALGNSIIHISAGINTSFAVSEDGSLYSWGMGGINLGLQDEGDLIVPTKVDSLDGKNVISVTTGGSCTSVLIEK